MKDNNFNLKGITEQDSFVNKKEIFGWWFLLRHMHTTFLYSDFYETATKAKNIAHVVPPEIQKKQQLKF